MLIEMFQEMDVFRDNPDDVENGVFVSSPLNELKLLSRGLKFTPCGTSMSIIIP